jgi:hypothetical protein
MMTGPMMVSVEVAGAMQAMNTMGSIDSIGMPQPVATNMRPPVPMQTQNAMRGGVTQVRVPGTTVRGEGAATFQQFAPTTVQTKEVGQAVYITGPTNEVDAGPQITQVRQEQLVAGEVQQQIVEIPTIQVIEQFQDVPEVQVVEKHVEVIQVQQETVEQIVEQHVHVPKIIPQRRVQHRSVEQIIHVPVPVMKEELIHVPRVVNQHRHHHVEVEQVVDVPVPQTVIEEVHVPKII